MARYTEAKCRLCRREGTKLFLKGARCFSEKCAMNKRAFPPGQHGMGRVRTTDYGRHLREKQKVKRIYGVLEAQFRRYYERAEKIKGVTGFILLQTLECRLDSVLYLSGLALSRGHARKLVRQKKVLVNGQVITIPSYEVSVHDEVSVKGVEVTPKENESFPVWMVWDGTKKAVVIQQLPARDDMNQEINEQLIVEYYSR